MRQDSTKLKFPIGVQTFQKMRSGNYSYIDKTDMVYDLCHAGGYYFLSRPRRFGKSLLISTMDAYFHGEKDLFKGLKIDKLESDWTPCPVLRFDFNSGRYDSVEGLREVMDIQLSQLEEIYGQNPTEKRVSSRFGGIIERAHKQTGQKVAILVDEYDKPLLQNIGNKDLQDDIRMVMKAFYSQIKTQDAHIRFACEPFVK